MTIKANLEFEVEQDGGFFRDTYPVFARGGDYEQSSRLHLKTAIDTFNAAQNAAVELLTSGTNDYPRIEIRNGKSGDYQFWVAELKNGNVVWSGGRRTRKTKASKNGPVTVRKAGKAGKAASTKAGKVLAKATKAKAGTTRLAQMVETASNRPSGDATLAELGVRQPRKFAPVALNPTPTRKADRKRDAMGRFEPSNVASVPASDDEQPVTRAEFNRLADMMERMLELATQG